MFCRNSLSFFFLFPLQKKWLIFWVWGRRFDWLIGGLEKRANHIAASRFETSVDVLHWLRSGLLGKSVSQKRKACNELHRWGGERGEGRQTGNSTTSNFLVKCSTYVLSVGELLGTAPSLTNKSGFYFVHVIYFYQESRSQWPV